MLDENGYEFCPTIIMHDLSIENNFRSYNLTNETEVILNNIESDINEYSNIPKYEVLNKLNIQ